MFPIPRLALIAAAALLALAVGTTPVIAAGPRIMIVYGRLLARPVIMSDWGENEGLMVAANDGMSVMHARLRGRPSFRMALFWGEAWVQYMKQRRPLSRLRPSEADQFARFYPAYGAAPPLLVFDSIPGPYTSLICRVGPDGLAILARHGIPIRLPLPGKASSSHI